MVKYKKVFKGRSKKFKKGYIQGEEESRQDYWDTRHVAKKRKVVYVTLATMYQLARQTERWSWKGC